MQEDIDYLRALGYLKEPLPSELPLSAPEDARFVNEYEITKEKVLNWYSSLNSPRRFEFWANLFLLLTNLFFFAIVFWFWWLFRSPLFLLCSGIMLGCVVYRVFGSRLSANRFFKDFSLNAENANYIRTISFGENNIQLAELNSTRTYPYSKMSHIEELEDCFRLWLEKEYFIVYKDAFTTGNAEEFGEFIQEKNILPFYNKRKHRMMLLKQKLPSLIVTTVLLVGLLFSFVVPLLRVAARTPFEALKPDAGIELIAEVPLRGGAAVFSLDGTSVDAHLVRKMLGRYIAVDAHTYPDIVYYNMAFTRPLFESDPALLSLDGGKTGVVYGVADAHWWEVYPFKSEQEPYTTVLFQCEGEYRVLYYRTFTPGGD